MNVDGCSRPGLVGTFKTMDNVDARKDKNSSANSALFSSGHDLNTRFNDNFVCANSKQSEDDGVTYPRPPENSTVNTSDLIKERLSIIEEHIGVAPSDNDILIRLRIIEDKIMRIEEQYPQVAIRVFKYTSEAPKGVGRVSKTPDSYLDTIANKEAALNDSNSIKKMAEMRNRMLELKNILK